MSVAPMLPDLTDAELEALSVLSPAERADAAAMWQQDAPPEGRALLDAVEDADQ